MTSIILHKMEKEEKKKFTLANVLGTARYWQNLGQSYAEMFRGSMTAGGIVTAAAAWLGVGKTGSVIIGICSIFFWQTLAILFGWAVWRWRIIHRTIEHEWRNSPLAVEQIKLLEAIERNTRKID